MKTVKRCLKQKGCASIAVIFFAGIFLAGPAYANFIDVNFERVTNNNVEDLSNQLNLRIYDATQATAAFDAVNLTGNQVLFAITNNVGTASNISEFYIDDGTVVSQSIIYNSLGGFTNFTLGSLGVDPGNLPGGNNVNPPFEATLIFSADTVSGPPTNGVNAAADILGIAYETTSGLAGIESALANGSLRVGFHIRSIGVAGGSDSYVNNGNGNVEPYPIPSPIPEPATMLLLGTGLVGVAVAARSKKKNQA